MAKNIAIKKLTPAQQAAEMHIKSAAHARHMAEIIEAELTTAQAHLESAKTQTYNIYGTGGGYDPDKIYRGIEHVDELRDTLERAYQDYAAQIAEYVEVLSALTTPEETIINMRYMRRAQTRAIARAIGCSERSVYTTLDAALTHYYEHMPRQYKQRKRTPLQGDSIVAQILSNCERFQQ